VPTDRACAEVRYEAVATRSRGLRCRVLIAGGASAAVVGGSANGIAQDGGGYGGGQRGAVGLGMVVGVVARMRRR
jgi:hypothetical protein